MKLQVEYVKPDSLRPALDNPRRISQKALRRLARLLDEHGFVDPIIARREDRSIIGGHQRIAANALRDKPDEQVPVVFLNGISDARAKALNIALNNPAAQGEFDLPQVARLLTDLDIPDLELCAVSGFDEGDIACMLRGVKGLQPIEPTGQTGEPTGEQVVLIFELSAEAYQRSKADFDELIAKHGLACHVRMEGPG